MQRGGITYYIYLLFSFLFVSITQAQYSTETIKMLFQHVGGGDSPYKYVNLEIYGDGDINCVFSRYNKEIKIDYKLSKQVTNRLIDLFQNQSFLELTQEKIKSMEQPVLDSGKTTLIYENGKIKKELSFVAIQQETVNQISSLCWKIFNQIIFLYDIEEAIETGENLGVISSLQSYVYLDNLIDVKEYMPLLIKFISDEKLRDSDGGFATQSISEIIGMDINWITTKPPTDNTIVANELLSWWRENKTKSRVEWLKDNMHKGEWKAACYLAEQGDKSSIPYLLKSLDNKLSWARQHSYGALCEITKRQSNEKEARFWYYCSDNKGRSKKIEKWHKWLVENGFLVDK